MLKDPEPSVSDIVASFDQCVAWCDARPLDSSPATRFRTLDVIPPFGDSWAWTVVHLIRNRGHKMERNAAVKEPRPTGALFVYRPDENLACGAAEVASGGFLDVDNAPPWGTWVTYVVATRALLSWVPTAYVDAVSKGIRVNPEECINWASDDRDGRVREIEAMLSKRR